MDKYEYKLKLEQLRNLVDEKKYSTAAEIADTINWRKVKSAATLCMVGEIYDKCKRYEDSHEILLMAYDRATVGRNILYRLTLVALKMGNLDEAKDYYEEFLEVAPYDNQKYILRYELEKMSGAGLPRLIEILEEFKEREYREEWAFELAYLYHRSGNAERCVEVCDELALWIGDGKYVEKALEMKMLYQPLNMMQEEKYREFLQKKKDVVEVRPTDNLESGEVVHETMTIPHVTANTGRFNTQNLQAEIAKSMQQIIDANSKETVNDTMDSLKKMVGDIPYLQVPQEETYRTTDDERYGHIETDEEIDDSLKNDFAELLAEDWDGQIRFSVPGGGVREPQVNGQLGIEEVLAEWERTRMAAETAMAAAQQKRLESAKARAMQEAWDLMERLHDIIPKLGPMSEETTTPQQEPGPEEMEIPEEMPQAADVEDDWKETARILGEPIPQEYLEQLEQEKAAKEKQILKEEAFEEEAAETAAEEIPAAEDLQMPQQELDAEDLQMPQQELDAGEMPGEEAKEPDDTEVRDDAKVRDDAAQYLQSVFKAAKASREEKNNVPEIEIEESEGHISKLSPEQKKIFSYFVPISGMEQQLCQVLEGALHRKEGDNTSSSGNILITGGRGSGKTVLATDIIKVIQKSTRKPGGKVGKITGEALNQKELVPLLRKIEGGYLIIEKAGDISQETATKLALLMEQETGGLLFIMEDTGKRIRDLLSLDANFAKKFTERVQIPIFTSDELVEFAKAYADEQECEIDDMGILALYNRISNIQKLDEATTLTEVKEIVDEAIARAERGGLKKIFGGKKFNPEGYLYLREKDFED